METTTPRRALSIPSRAIGDPGFGRLDFYNVDARLLSKDGLKKSKFGAEEV